MKTMMHVGSNVSMKEAAEPVAAALVSVLAAISEGRIDREVAIEAIKVVGQTAGVNCVTVRDCTFTNKSDPDPSFTFGSPRYDYAAFVGKKDDETDVDSSDQPDEDEQ